ncbi:MAG: hypothetical protein ACK4TK_03540 [Thiobacillaceae bacterium]
MNSTVLALLLLTSLNVLPERPTATPVAPPAVAAVSPFQHSEQRSRLAAKGRQPQERLQLRMEQRIAVATAAP